MDDQLGTHREDGLALGEFGQGVEMGGCRAELAAGPDAGELLVKGECLSDRPHPLDGFLKGQRVDPAGASGSLAQGLDDVGQREVLESGKNRGCDVRSHVVSECVEEVD